MSIAKVETYQADGEWKAHVPGLLTQGRGNTEVDAVRLLAQLFAAHIFDGTTDLIVDLRHPRR